MLPNAHNQPMSDNYRLLYAHTHLGNLDVRELALELLDLIVTSHLDLGRMCLGRGAEVVKGEAGVIGV